MSGERNIEPMDLAFREGEALRVEDVMRVLHLSRNTVYKLARTGELASFRVGRQLRFRYDDVMDRLMASSPSFGATTIKRPGNQATKAVRGNPEPGRMGLGPSVDGDSAQMRQGSTAEGESSPVRPELASGREYAEVRTSGQEYEPFSAGADIMDALPTWARGSVVIGGQDLAGDIISNYLANFGIKTIRSHENSYLSLARMYAGTCHAALLNLWSEAEQTYNAPYVRAFLPGVSAIVFRLYRHRVGFTVAAHNPKAIKEWVDLIRPEVTIANRPRGDGSRVLLDEKLKYLEAVATHVHGYDREFPSDLAQALVVSRGLADVAVTDEKPARQTGGLEFLPLQDEEIDLCVVKAPATEPLIKALRSLLRTKALRSEFDADLCDTSLMGEVRYES